MSTPLRRMPLEYGAAISRGSNPGMAIRELILEQFRSVAREHHETLAPLADPLPLLDSGLDSLSFAVIVARLEDVLGVDPFSAEEFLDFPVTFGDFVRLYETAVTKTA